MIRRLLSRSTRTPRGAAAESRTLLLLLLLLWLLLLMMLPRLGRRCRRWPDYDYGKVIEYSLCAGIDDLPIRMSPFFQRVFAANAFEKLLKLFR